nr:MAG: hypothetical protein 1 [Leviviridae sp.]
MPPQKLDQKLNTDIGVYTSPTGSSIQTSMTKSNISTFTLGYHGNYGWPDVGDRKNVGHSAIWSCEAQEYGVAPLDRPIRGSGTSYRNHRYEGGVAINPSLFSFPSIPNIDFTGEAWGATAYSKMKPTQPDFSALNSIYELREIPGMLKQRFNYKDLKSISNYWLALQFGWRPLLNDVRNFVTLQRSAQQRLKQLLRDNGRPVRRRLDIHDLTSDPVFTIGSDYHSLNPTFVTQFYQRMTTFRYTSTIRDHCWASARFRFWLPGGPRDIHWKRRMLARIYGLTPSPSVIYNAIPWSWLVDWFTNLGDLIENLDGGVADRLASDYFYIMRTWEKKVVKDATGFYLSVDGEPVSATASAHRTRTRKSRLIGNPFGFAPSQVPLSAMQWSILGALGLSRL